jgi:hypothetical protein
MTRTVLRSANIGNRIGFEGVLKNYQGPGYSAKASNSCALEFRERLFEGCGLGSADPLAYRRTVMALGS